ncbi:hypothetical protein GCM10007304_07720 [Rhodococcoides trifolii]|uniref:Uncharacterized protein n=1 Tax=Rhodococcoides trifolii TaxID=908250 RepID=A0A917FNR9_9NOCA|nr:hypothetical protein [Rhodococcus trifolii]GGF96215.1 hypothetical protein GCM10007304_07720 [Rhodococcus trifolii]
MAVPLRESLLDEAKGPALLADVRGLIDSEVSDKGLTVKAVYGTVKKVGPSVIDDAIIKLWPGFVESLEPFWQQYQAAPTGTFGDYLVANSDAASDALLGVTDARIEETTKSAIKKGYSSLRPSAKKNVTAALPRLGDLIQKHATA